MTARESNPNRISLRLQGKRAIAEAALAAREFGQAQRLGAEPLARLCIVIEELMANLFDHAGLTEADEVLLDLDRESDGVRVSIADTGRSFDPWSAQPPASSRGGGSGLRLIQAWSIRIRYDSSLEGNRLELRIPFSRANPDSR